MRLLVPSPWKTDHQARHLTRDDGLFFVREH